MDEIDPKLLAKVKEFFPSLSDTEAKEVAENLLRYAQLIWRWLKESGAYLPSNSRGRKRVEFPGIHCGYDGKPV